MFLIGTDRKTSFAATQLGSVYGYSAQLAVTVRTKTVYTLMLQTSRIPRPLVHTLKSSSLVSRHQRPSPRPLT